MQTQLQVVSTHSGVCQLNPSHRGRDVIGGVPSCFRRVSSVHIATASGGGTIHKQSVPISYKGTTPFLNKQRSTTYVCSSGWTNINYNFYSELILTSKNIAESINNN